jgi:hypothetical protein
MGHATQGSAPRFGTSSVAATPITFTIYDQAGTTLGSGFVMPSVNGWNLTHNVEVARTKDSNGDITATTGHGEMLECQFDLLPIGSTLADMRKSLTLPPVMATVAITGADIFPAGSFVDAINTNGSSTQRWIYEGGGSVSASNEGHARLSVTLRRYPGITGGAAITD